MDGNTVEIAELTGRIDDLSEKLDQLLKYVGSFFDEPLHFEKVKKDTWVLKAHYGGVEIADEKHLCPDWGGKQRDEKANPDA